MFARALLVAFLLVVAATVEAQTPVESARTLVQRYHLDPTALDRARDRVAGARYVCVSCHAAKTDAPNLVENHFRP